MDNVFQIGGQVTGNSFIGRKKELEYLTEAYLNNSGRTGKAIIGLTRMGKTSMALNVFQNLPGNVIYVYEDLNEWSQYDELWQDICYSVEEYLKEHGKLSESLQENLISIQTENLPWIKLNRTVKKIFEELAQSGLKTILVLDEFDNASSLFDGGTKHFELFRTIFSDGKYDVSAMTISRRNLHTIEGTTYQSSTFHGVLDSIYFKGFSDEDMQCYYDVFSKTGINLTDDQKDEIDYYAGRAPFLLSIIGHYILESAKSEESIDVSRIFLNKCKAINDYYRDCIQHLNRDNDIKRIIPFVIGPNIGVTQNDRDELINLGYLREDNGQLIAISEYFSTFLSSHMLSISIWDNIINVEKKIKLLIEKEFLSLVDHYKVDGESVIAVQRNVLASVPGITAGDIARYDSFIANNAKVFDIQSTYLDVMSLNDSFKVLKDCWVDIFAKYFNNDLYDNWNLRFEKCARARNPIAHGHEEYLSDIDKSEIDAYCKQIFDQLSSMNNSVVNIDDEEIVSKAEKYKGNNEAITKIEYENPEAGLIGKEIDFVVLKRGGVKRSNLSGVIMNKYRGTIPKNYLEGIDLDAMIGTTVKAVVSAIDGDHYMLKYSNTKENVANKKETSMGYSIADLVAEAIKDK